MDDTQIKDDGHIRPWSENPSYWQYRGEPLLLLGGSLEDNLFQIPELEAHLDLLASVGGNYIRNTMSDRDPGNVYPYLQMNDGRYDLEKWNPEYWYRFEKLLNLTAERDIIVQIEVWDRFDLTDAKNLFCWQHHPYNPALNINYTPEQTLLADSYLDHPGHDLHPFYHTVPGMKKYRPEYDVIRTYQERFVEKLLSYTLTHGHVLYCMNNETSTEPLWGQYWIQFILERARRANVAIYASDMFDNVWQPEESIELRLACDTPKLYNFLDVSQVNSRNFGEYHWRLTRWIVERAKQYPRPVNHVKIYSDGQTSFGSGTPQEGIERFWRNLIAGAASSRFHRPPSGIALNETAQACLRSARLVQVRAPFWKHESAMELLSDRAPNAAYISANPGQSYILFFSDGGSVTVDFSEASGLFTLVWIDIRKGQISAEQIFQGGSPTSIHAPSSGPWTAVFTR